MPLTLKQELNQCVYQISQVYLSVYIVFKKSKLIKFIKIILHCNYLYMYKSLSHHSGETLQPLGCKG